MRYMHYNMYINIPSYSLSTAGICQSKSKASIKDWYQLILCYKEPMIQMGAHSKHKLLALVHFMLLWFSCNSYWLKRMWKQPLSSLCFFFTNTFEWHTNKAVGSPHLFIIYQTQGRCITFAALFSLSVTFIRSWLLSVSNSMMSCSNSVFDSCNDCLTDTCQQQHPRSQDFLQPPNTAKDGRQSSCRRSNSSRTSRADNTFVHKLYR